MQAEFVEATQILIETTISEFSLLIAEKYGIQHNDLMSLWSSGDAPSSQSPRKTIREPPLSREGTGERTCPYEFSRGAKRGTRCCTILKRDEDYCSKHRPPSSKKKKKKKAAPGTVFRRHRFHTEYLWNPETGFAMKTQEEGILGRIVETEAGSSSVEIGLSSNDIQRCQELNLPFCSIPPTDKPVV